uniref:Uncharacterized protein n=1 Tax=Meloidogyne floridensis TaxID=298350 RepID=A0A915PD02_9BILA
MAKFHLLPQNEYVTIPEDLFIYSGFLREYKKGMLNDKFCRNLEENLIIPLPPIAGKPVYKHYIEKLCEYTRHNYGPGSSAKRVPSSVDIRNSNGQKNGNSVSNNKMNNKSRNDDNNAAGRSPEKSSSGTFIADMEAKADAKWSKLPDWAHGWFSALDKDILISTANVASFLTATPFVEHFANFLAIKVQEMENEKQIMEYLNYKFDDFEGARLKQQLYIMSDYLPSNSNMLPSFCSTLARSNSNNNNSNNILQLLTPRRALEENDPHLIEWIGGTKRPAEF